ncbi:SPOR domain-containing protein [Uliginosibacterium sp. 31-16]|uniref:SPOR domain-containing protein n=1 Tax=Uliginosibacterium sp. 31-16 TaxID=3068315 RepID=UPI00273F412A|nr:SPOR domain-containing protein [Uliginosibacterium sp. 31-16]MDP5241133.1 SPOR domain-containing protein [Uliginosibacterium sp. 31-16]
MKTLRPFFYLLLAANIVLAVLSALPLLGIRPPWAPSGEADRLARQLTPEKIQLITTETRAAPASVSTAITPTTDIRTNIDPNALACAALRNLNLEATQQLSDRAARQGDGLSVRLIGVTPTSYWVNIPPNGGKEGASKRGEVLTKVGVEDYFIERKPGPNQFAISLGLYLNEDAAKRQLEQLRKKGVTTARITVRDNTGNNARAEISGRNEYLEPLIKDFLASHKDAQRESCQPGN